MYTIPDFDPAKEFNDLQWFQFYDKYSKFNRELKRRETWEETVTRTVDFLRELSQNKLNDSLYQEIFDAIYKMEISPSMRLFSNAGVSARRTNESIYNCSFVPANDKAVFGELLWLSICGVGVGFSVEHQNVNRLPTIQPFRNITQLFQIPDTSEGWKQSLDILVNNLYDGVKTDFDYSLIRKEGTPLLTKGGTASGPKVLQEIHSFFNEVFAKAVNRKLTSLEVHDLLCKTADAGISGGVRRAALISIFDFDDNEMKHCKDGDYYKTHPYRMNANNSAVWDKELTIDEIEYATMNMFETGSGEPGIVNRNNNIKSSPSWRTFRFPELVGNNPC